MNDTERAIAQALLDLGDAYLYKQETVQRMARFFSRELERYSPAVIRRATAEAIRTCPEFPRVSQVVELAIRYDLEEIKAAPKEVQQRPPDNCPVCHVAETFWRDAAEFDSPEYVAFTRHHLKWEQLLEFKHRADCSRRRSSEWPLPSDAPRLRVVS